MEINPYEAPSTPIGLEAGDLGTSSGVPSEERDLRIFVGRNPDYYLRKWANALRGSGGAGFNLAGFLLSGFWLPYRKMYRIAFVLYGILVAEGVVEVLIVSISPGAERPVEMIGRLLGLVASIVVGLKGNDWYLAHARTVIGQTRSLDLPDDAFTRELARRGGTNIFAALGLFLLFIGLVVAIATIAGFISGEIEVQP